MYSSVPVSIHSGLFMAKICLCLVLIFLVLNVAIMLMIRGIILGSKVMRVPFHSMQNLILYIVTLGLILRLLLAL